MCRKFALIANIEQASIKDIVTYCFRAARIYVIFFLIDVITLGTTAHFALTSAKGIYIGGLVFYFLSTVSLFAVGIAQHNGDNLPPPLSRVFIALINVVALLFYNLFSTLFNIIVLKSYFAIFGILSVILQSGTAYLLYKLIHKIKASENDLLPTANANPIQETATPMATAVPFSYK